MVLDELHKWRDWKRWLKGEYDAHRDRHRFLVTGSARLDVYRRGGDSLQGRYHHWRLHPFTIAEMDHATTAAVPEPGREIAVAAGAARRASLDVLLAFGGFPEPLIAASTRTLRRWQKERVDRFFREDVRDVATVHDLGSLEMLADLVPARVGSPLSLNSLREDLEVSHTAVSRWVELLDRLYHLFLIRPFALRTLRGLKKMPKAYLWDTSLVDDSGARFENLVALHLLKLCHFMQDRDGHRVDLHYLRDTAGREVDFLVTWNGKPWFAVEAKVGDETLAPALRYFRERLRIPYAYQVVLSGTADYVKDGIRCLPAAKFLAALV